METCWKYPFVNPMMAKVLHRLARAYGGRPSQWRRVPLVDLLYDVTVLNQADAADRLGAMARELNRR